MQQQERHPLGCFQGELCSSRLGHRLAKADCHLPCSEQLQRKAPGKAFRLGLTSFPYSKNTAPLNTYKERPCLCWQHRLRKLQLGLKYLFSNLNATPGCAPRTPKKQELVQKPGPPVVSNPDCTKDSKFFMESPRFTESMRGKIQCGRKQQGDNKPL